MDNESNINRNDRRDFLKKMALTSSMACFGFGGIFKLAASSLNSYNSNSNDFDFQYRTFSVDHLPELKKWFEKLKNEMKGLMKVKLSKIVFWLLRNSFITYATFFII